MTLACDSLGLERGGAQVLEAVSASFAPGQITAICGPNGAGKSSLLMALAGLLMAESGAVSLAGASLASIHPQDRARRIGYLPQEAVVAWDVAVENVVRLGRMPWRDRGVEAVERAIATLDLQDLRHRPVSHLSGGEKARALLARVLAGEPEWILADEPLAALDLGHQLALMRNLHDAAAQGAGVVLVLHDLAMAMNHADRVLVLDQGRAVADGAPEQALSPEVIAQVWGVTGKWLGQPGARALVTS
ncbi:ABC transporter ATP-binding protein [Altererythrobacter sp.]|uniref:ABC transporter ATP-binding protein n=1 Tax=Altererythrobacter sp. TaxID=1872480 RepID=UPI003D146C3B